MLKHTLKLLSLIILVFGLFGARAADLSANTYSFCGELKSVELTSSLYGWGMAQVFNEVVDRNPLVSINDYPVVEAILSKLPPDEVATETFRNSLVWNATIGSEGTYLLCFQATEMAMVVMGGRTTPVYSNISMFRLFFQGDLILTFYKPTAVVTRASSAF